MSIVDEFKPFVRSGWPTPVNPEMTVDGIHEDLIIHQNGRFFVKAAVSLPLHEVFSPVQIQGLWVEVERDLVDATIIAMTKQGQELLIEGTLAKDLPGFPKTSGSRVTVLLEEDRARIVRVADARVPQGKMTEQKLLELYRKVWGNPSPLFVADTEQRSKVINAIERMFGTDLTVLEVEMPPPLLGNTPPEVILAADPDGCTACTVGASDLQPETGERFELLLEMNRFSKPVLDRFSEFCFFTGSNMIRPGTFIGSSLGPLGDSEFTGWLITDPMVTDITKIDDTDISLYQISPIYPEELFVGVEDPYLVASGLLEADRGDFNRPSVV